jgi:hypothetical protein
MAQSYRLLRTSWATKGDFNSKRVSHRFHIPPQIKQSQYSRQEFHRFKRIFPAKRSVTICVIRGKMIILNGFFQQTICDHLCYPWQNDYSKSAAGANLSSRNDELAFSAVIAGRPNARKKCLIESMDDLGDVFLFFAHHHISFSIRRGDTHGIPLFQ